MKHCAYEDRLTSWLLGDLPPAEAETIRRHVAECGACRALAGELEPVVAALRQGLSEEPAKPLRLYPSRRRQVLATPYQSRFRRWWRGTHPMLRLAASLALVVGFAWMALMPAFSYRAKRAARAPMYYPYADSVECLEEVAELEEVAPPAVDAMRQPEVPAFTPDFSLSPRPRLPPRLKWLPPLGRGCRCVPVGLNPRPKAPWLLLRHNRRYPRPPAQWQAPNRRLVILPCKSNRRSSCATSTAHLAGRK